MNAHNPHSAILHTKMQEIEVELLKSCGYLVTHPLSILLYTLMNAFRTGRRFCANHAFIEIPESNLKKDCLPCICGNGYGPDRCALRISLTLCASKLISTKVISRFYCCR